MNSDGKALIGLIAFFALLYGFAVYQHFTHDYDQITLGARSN